jgi:hypothetical protein
MRPQLAGMMDGPLRGFGLIYAFRTGSNVSRSTMNVQQQGEIIDILKTNFQMITDASVALPVLVGKVFEEASPTERGRLLEQLLKPLGILALVAIANGNFARLTLVNGWSRLTIRAEDTQFIESQDVVALASRVQQISMQAIEGLSHIVSTSPMLAGSTAAAMLLAVLAKQRLHRTQIAFDDLDDLS